MTPAKLRIEIWVVVTLTTAIFLSQVLEVEDEMRILLQENALTKKTLEQRLKKLSSAFTEIQHDLGGSWLKDTMTSFASNFNDLLVPKMLDHNEPNFSSDVVKTSLNWHTQTLEEIWIVYFLCSTNNPWYFEVISVGMGNFLRISKLLNVAQFFCGIWITHLSSADIRHCTMVLLSFMK